MRKFLYRYQSRLRLYHTLLYYLLFSRQFIRHPSVLVFVLRVRRRPGSCDIRYRVLCWLVYLATHSLDLKLFFFSCVLAESDLAFGTAQMEQVTMPAWEAASPFPTLRVLGPLGTWDPSFSVLRCFCFGKLLLLGRFLFRQLLFLLSSAGFFSFAAFSSSASSFLSDNLFSFTAFSSASVFASRLFFNHFLLYWDLFFRYSLLFGDPCVSSAAFSSARFLVSATAAMLQLLPGQRLLF